MAKMGPEAIYFNKAQHIAENSKHRNDIVTMQWFQRSNNVVVSGIKQVINTIKQYSPNWKQLKVKYRSEGEIVNNEELVLTVTGRYADFCFLEGIIDGILGAQSTIATNARKLIKVANSKPIIYMNDRNNYIETQKYDGYAAYIGGIRYFTSWEQIKLLPQSDTSIKIIGSIPHSLIQLYKGNLSEVLEDYIKRFPNDHKIALVDYNNDAIQETLSLAKKYPQLYAVRIDTSIALIDKSLQNSDLPKNEIRGVNHHLISLLRNELNSQGFPYVKIIVSSGLDELKIQKIEDLKTPVDYYGVGLAFKKNYINFTGDSVLLNGQKEAKVGREIKNTSKLQELNWQDYDE